MAAPLPSTVTLGSDTVYTGKQLRAQSTSVSGVAVNETFYIPTPAFRITGAYAFVSAQFQLLSVAQNGTTSGIFWVYVPTTAIITAMIHRINISCGALNATSGISNSTISFSKFTWTGTGTANASVPLPLLREFPQAQTTVITNNTGMTTSLAGDFAVVAMPTMYGNPSMLYFNREVLAYNQHAYQRGFCFELAAGEGLVAWQSQAATLLDPRGIKIQIEWNELDLS